MKKFLVVLQYELVEYFKNKAFMVFTVLLAIGGAIALFLPRFIDMSGVTGVQVKNVGKEQAVEETKKSEEKDVLILYDENGIADIAVLEAMFAENEWIIATDAKQVQSAVEDQSALAGFVITSASEYTYYVYNKDMFDRTAQSFEEAMRIFYRMNYCEANGLDFTEVSQMYQVPITTTEEILNKDTESSYWYCYALVMIVFMLIILYGQMIAVSVTNEKSNRAIEVLVTSTTPNSLLFGKVIAGAIGGLFQTGVILGSILLSYQANRQQWGGMLDMFLSVPKEVLLTFALFGMGGYLFYAFLYGAMGALVSKTEDISKSSGGLMVIIMVVYFFALMQLTNVEGTIIKVLSFLPFSSYSTMFARIAMGTVAPWEIILSFVILVASIFGAGFIGAKLYRMGTLRYGNPIKLSTALKDIRKAE